MQFESKRKKIYVHVQMHSVCFLVYLFQISTGLCHLGSDFFFCGETLFMLIENLR